MAVAPETRPVRLVLREDDLRRRRLTVLFRLVLALPHLVWLFVWALAAFIVFVMLWVSVVVGRQALPVFHEFIGSWVRYATHVSAYLSVAAGPYPGFAGAEGYPIDIEIDAPARQSRWTALFRPILALPALAITLTFGAVLAWSAVAGPFLIIIVIYPVLFAGGVLTIASILAWFSSLVRGRCPRGLHDLIAFVLGYAAQAAGYLLMLTSRYPSTDPATLQPTPSLPEHPVRLVVRDELQRSRLTVFFRLLLALPHIVWLALWSIAAVLAVIAGWFAALVTGRMPSALHRLLAAFVRYAAHVRAFLILAGAKFPGFTGRQGSYGIDIEIAGPESQRRWKTLFRLILVLPALALTGLLNIVLFVVAVLGWWYAIILGRMPAGLRNIGAAITRYDAQTYSYLFLLTDRYPYASPVLEGSPRLDESQPPSEPPPYEPPPFEAPAPLPQAP